MLNENDRKAFVNSMVDEYATDSCRGYYVKIFCQEFLLSVKGLNYDDLCILRKTGSIHEKYGAFLIAKNWA